MSKVKVFKMENMSLKSDGVVRSKRCNTISFYCPVCDQFHTQERKYTYVIDLEDSTLMICEDELIIGVVKIN